MAQIPHSREEHSWRVVKTSKFNYSLGPFSDYLMLEVHVYQLLSPPPPRL